MRRKVGKGTYGTSLIVSMIALDHIGWRRVIVDHGSAMVHGIHQGIVRHYVSDTSMFLAGWPVHVLQCLHTSWEETGEGITWNTWVKVSPGPMGHWVSPVGPSMEFVPFWKRPWKCKPVVWLPSWLVRCTVICSPTWAVMVGGGHCPLIAITGLCCKPSGFAESQPMFQLYWAADTQMPKVRRYSRGKIRNIVAVRKLKDIEQPKNE